MPELSTPVRTVLLVCLCLTLFSFQSPQSSLQEYTLNETIWLSGDSGRNLLLPESGAYGIRVCGLKKGKLYQLELTPAPHSKAKSALFPNGLSSYSFVAGGTCMELSLAIVGSGPVFLTHFLKKETDQAPPGGQKVLAPISTSQAPASTLINNVFIGGDCYDVSGVTSSGGASQMGTFTNGLTSIGFNDGIILSTGNINVATGPNNATGAGTNAPNGFDPDLAAITSGVLTDVTIIEFDFTPTNDTVSFEYVFASEEYCDFVGSIFNDVFGFFISGPGINGPYTNNAANIAVIPGTATPVTINNVNHNSFPGFYVGNIPAGSGQLGDPDCSGHPVAGGPSVNDCQFDGFTTVLTAFAIVQPCQTYHIKLAISDVGDSAYDSAVFLKENSFDSGGQAKVQAFGSVSGTNIIYEGCTGGYFLFTRDGNDLSQPVTINFTIDPSSTATPGVDYSTLPTSITIPAGQSSFQLNVNVFADLIPEGQESIILELDVPCDCTNPTIELFIEDPPPIELGLGDEELCATQAVTLDPAATGGIPNYTYDWSDGSSGSTLTVNPSGAGTETYYVTVTDDCGNMEVDTATITILEAPTADISGDATICAEGDNSPADLTINFTGTGPWEVIYEIDGVQQTPIITTDNPFIITTSQLGNFSLVSVSSGVAGCPGTVSGNASVTEILVTPSLTPADISCNGANDGAINLTISGGTAPYSYNWDNGAGSGQNPVDLPPGTYNVTVTDDNGCTGTATTSITDPPLLESSVDAIVDIDCNNGTGSVDLSVTGGTPPYSFNWDNGGGSVEDPSGLAPGTYNVTVTDANGCIVTATATINEDITPPNAAANAPGVITCAEPELELDGNGSSTGNEFVYEWTTNGGNILSGSNTLNPTIDAPGTYTLTVTNTNNGCTQTASVNIGEDTTPPSAAASAPELTCAVTEVTIDASGSSSGPDFSYNWSTNDGNIVSGGTSLNPVVNQAGTYTLTVVNDINGCETDLNVTVSEDITPPAAVASGGNLTCVLLQFTIDGNGSSAGPDFTYDWTTNDGNILSGSSTLNPVVDAPGTYTLTVVNGQNGCESTTDVSVGLDNTPPIANAGPDLELNCGNPTIQLDGSGSSSGPGINYLWTTTDGSISGGAGTANPTVSSAGTYTLTVTNINNGCESTASVEVTEDFVQPQANVLPPQLITCFVPQITLDGSTSSGGTNLSFNWSTPNGNIVNGQNSPFPVVDEGGVYTLSVTNTDNQCTDDVTIIVNEDTVEPTVNAGAPQELTCVVSEVVLEGWNSSAGPNFGYQWATTDGNIVSGGTTPAPVVNEAGTYTLTVTNLTNGCDASASTFVTVDEAVPVADAGPDQQIDCINAQISINGTNSSAGSDFTYQWNTVDGNIVSGANTTVPVVNQPGTYELTVINTENGCEAFSSVEVIENTLFPDIVIADPDGIDCFVPEIQIDASASTGAGSLLIQWTTGNGNIVSGANTLNPTVDAGGFYTIQITDTDNGCISFDGVTVEAEIENPFVAAEPADLIDCNNPTTMLDASASDSGPNYVINWTTQDGMILSGAATPTPVVGSGGTYEVLVTNTDNNCSSSALVIVPEDVLDPIVSIADPESINCVIDTFDLNATVGGGSNFVYTWTTANGNIIAGDQTLTPTVNAAGTYQLQVVNTDNGCDSEETVVVIEDVAIPIADAGPPASITCAFPLIQLDGSNSDAGADLTYEWTTPDGNIVGGASTLTPEVDAPGQYILTVSNSSNLCVASAAVNIAENTVVPNASAGQDLILGCTSPTLELNGSGSSTGAQIVYSWQTTDGNIISGADTPAPVIDAEGQYELLVVDTINGCQDQDQVAVVLNLDEPVVDAGPGGELTCTQTTIQLQATASGNTDDFVYEWELTVGGNIVSGGSGLEPIVDAEGTYTLIATDTLNGCSGEAVVIITQDDNVPVANAVADDHLDCVTPSITLDGTNSTQGPDIQFEWSTLDGNIINGASTLQPEVNSGGTYTLTITDEVNDCVSTASVTIIPDTLPPQASLVPDGLITCATPEVSVEATVSNAGGDLSLIWTTPDGNIIGDTDQLVLEVDAPGTYELAVLNNENGCSSDAAIFIDEDVVLPNVDAGPEGLLTCGILNYTLNGEADADGAAFDFNWSTTDGNIQAGQFSLTPIVNAPGTYQLEVTNLENGCVNQSAVIVTEDVVLPLADAGPADILNCYQSNLELNGAGSSQGPEFVYTWTTPNGNILQGAGTLSPEINAPGTYTLTVENQTNDCVSEAVVEILEDIQEPDIDAATPGALTCTQLTQQLSGITNSTGPDFTYQWTTTSGNILSGEQTLTPLVDEPGAYQLEIFNQINGCASTISVNVPQDVDFPQIEAGDSDPLTCVVLAVSLDGTASETDPDFTYEWTTLNGNIISGSDGLNPVVDLPAYYWLTITDQQNGCVSLDSVLVELDDVAPIAATEGDGLITCDDPQISLSGAGSSTGSEYEYNWSTIDGNILSGNATLNPIVDAPGTYTLLVTNQNNGCESSIQTEVDEATDLPLTLAGTPDILTCIQTSIELDATASSNGPEFDYLWQTTDGTIVSGATTATPIVNAPGTYELLIENSETGCTSTISVEVLQDIVDPVAEAGPAALLNCDITSLGLEGEASGNSPNLSFNWTTTGGNILSGNTTLTPVIDAPGVYTLTVIDENNGCTDTDVVAIDQDITPPNLFIADPGILTCVVTTLQLNATASDQGVNFVPVWITADGDILSGGSTLTPEIGAPGTYTLQIENTENGCDSELDIIVEEDVAFPVVDAGDSFVLPCFEDVASLNGTVTANTANLQIGWTTFDGALVSGQTTLSPSIEAGGTYILSILNMDNGCASEDEVIVTEDFPVDPLVDIQDPPCFGDLGTLQVSGVTGGTTPYVYSIDGGDSFSPATFYSGLTPGFYDVLVQDANGCETEPVEVYITEPIELTLTLEAKAEIQLGDSYQLQALVNIPDSEIGQIIWTPAESLSCSDCLDPIATPYQSTTYKVYIENLNGCDIEAEVRVVVDRRPAVYIPNGFSPNGDGDNDVFMIFAKDGSVANIQSFLVFSRWGETVYEYYDFQPNDPAYSWDGDFRGEAMDPAVFVYFAIIEMVDGSVELFEGDVTLVR